MCADEWRDIHVTKSHISLASLTSSPELTALLLVGQAPPVVAESFFILAGSSIQLERVRRTHRRMSGTKLWQVTGSGCLPTRKPKWPKLSRNVTHRDYCTHVAYIRLHYLWTHLTIAVSCVCQLDTSVSLFHE